jgi:hypothetical protein
VYTEAVEDKDFVMFDYFRLVNEETVAQMARQRAQHRQPILRAELKVVVPL